MTNLFKQQQSMEDHSKLLSVAEVNGVSPKNQRSRGNQRNLAIFLCLLFLATFSTYAQNEKLRIAVLNITNAPTVTSCLITELVNTNKYIVVERAQIQKNIRRTRVPKHSSSNSTVC
ncbi:MAG: hypothetical protein FWG84_07170 [Bacteroidales bacterium]|nr:hypothetical protein [Bacteroidales bacterium]